MLNKEKYLNDIIDCIACGKLPAVTTKGEIACCSSIHCGECLFYTDTTGCRSAFKLWCNEEYHEEKRFTLEEIQLIRLLDTIKYVARDKNGYLYGYTHKPRKSDDIWVLGGGEFCKIHIATTICKFEDIKFDDEEPVSRDEILNSRIKGVV